MLLLVELLFCLPVSNAVVERLFSMTKRIMTRLRCSLGQIRLNHLIKISLEGPSLKEFDAMPAIDIWARKTTRHPNQRERKRYKSRNKDGIKVKVLIDESLATSDGENEDGPATLSELIEIL